MAANKVVGSTADWRAKYDAGQLPAGCETQSGCILTVKRQCMEENCCKLHSQLVEQNCGLSQMLALESTELCQDALAQQKNAGCSSGSTQNALVANALTEYQVAHTGGAKTGLVKQVGNSCASMIAKVQQAIGVSADGQWGPKSQAALDARGGDFRAFAPGCADPVPRYSGGKTTEVTTTVAPNAIVAPVASGSGGIPAWAWFAGAAVAIGLVAHLSASKNVRRNGKPARFRVRKRKSGYAVVDTRLNVTMGHEETKSKALSLCWALEIDALRLARYGR